MIIKTKQGFKELNVLERISKHTGNQVYKNKRITVDHGLGSVSHQDYYAVKLNK